MRRGAIGTAGALSHIELELAPCPERPFGDRRFVYHLYLPLGVDGRLDLGALRSGDVNGQVRRRRPEEPELVGEATLEPDGRLIFRFAARPSNRELGFRSPPDHFVIGRVVPILEDDGEQRLFQVIAIRHPPRGRGQAFASFAV